MNDELISSLYAAAMGEASWNETFERVSRVADDAALLLATGVPNVPSTFEFWSTGLDNSTITDAGFEPADMWNANINPMFAAGLIVPVGKSYDVRSFVRPQQFEDATFLRGTMLRQGLVHSRVFAAFRDPDLPAGGFAAGRDGRELSERAIQTLDQLIPHMARALRMRYEVNRHRQASEGLAALVEGLPIALVLVDRNATIVFRNASADAVLAAGDGLGVRDGRLKAPDSVLRAIYEAAVPTSIENEVSSGSSSLPVQRPSGRLPYALRINPACGTTASPAFAGANVAILIHDAVSNPSLPRKEVLMQLFGLTPSEAAVARLVPLATTKREIADELGITENTVKTHLSSVRQKLGANSVAHLGQMVGSLAILNTSEIIPSPLG